MAMNDDRIIVFLKPSTEPELAKTPYFWTIHRYRADGRDEYPQLGSIASGWAVDPTSAALDALKAPR